jgi:hypothetical protein
MHDAHFCGISLANGALLSLIISDGWPLFIIDWAAFVSLFPQDVLQRLRKEEKRKSAEAMRALARAKTQREQLFALLTNIIGGRAPSTDALVLLRGHWLAGVSSNSWAPDTCGAAPLAM